MFARVFPTWVLVALLGLGVALAWPNVVASPAVAQPSQQAVRSARAVVEDFNDSLVGAMKTDGFQARYSMLERPVRESFLLDVMVRTAVGRWWRDATPEQRNALVEAFGSLTTAQYASRFHDYNGQEFRVLDTDEGPRGTSIVRTEITRADKEPARLSYVLAQRDGHWGIVDVLAGKGVSELAIRRSEYAAILERRGIEGLVETLHAKSRIRSGD